MAGERSTTHSRQAGDAQGRRRWKGGEVTSHFAALARLEDAAVSMATGLDSQ